MSKPAPIHICFYSNHCKWSETFIREISQSKYRGDFRYICVDPSPSRPALPSWLKKVPTLLIRGEEQPRTDREVLNWLYEQRIRDGASQSGEVLSVEPEPYLDTEMGGSYGDSYSFIEMDTSTSGDGGLHMKHNFTYLDGQAAVSTKEASSFPSSSSHSKRSKKEEMLDQQMEQYLQSRDQGIPQRVARQ